MGDSYWKMNNKLGSEPVILFQLMVEDKNLWVVYGGQS